MLHFDCCNSYHVLHNLAMIAVVELSIEEYYHNKINTFKITFYNKNYDDYFFFLFLINLCIIALISIYISKNNLAKVKYISIHTMNIILCYLDIKIY